MSYSCDLCRHRFSSETESKELLADHKCNVHYECTQCANYFDPSSSSFETSFKLRIHLRHHHRAQVNAGNYPWSNDEDNAFLGQAEGLTEETVLGHFPGRTLEQVQERLQHLTEYSDQEPVSSSLASSQAEHFSFEHDEQPREFICSQCNTGFKCEDYLEIHRNNVENCRNAMSDARFRKWPGSSTSNVTEGSKYLHGSRSCSPAILDGASSTDCVHYEQDTSAMAALPSVVRDGSFRAGMTSTPNDQAASATELNIGSQSATTTLTTHMTTPHKEAGCHAPAFRLQNASPTISVDGSNLEYLASQALDLVQCSSNPSATVTRLEEGKPLFDDDIAKCLEFHDRNCAQDWRWFYPGYPNNSRGKLTRPESLKSNLLFILNISEHWVVVHLNHREGFCKLYDSAATTAYRLPEVNEIIKGWLEIQGFNTEVKSSQKECPQQNDSVNCGVFCLAIAAALLTGESVPTSVDPKKAREHYASLLSGSSPTPSDHPSLTDSSVENIDDDVASICSPSQHATPPSSSYMTERQLGVISTCKAQTTSTTEWTIEKIASRLRAFSQDVGDGHAQLVAYVIESTKPVERRIFHGDDLFAGVKIDQIPENKGQTMSVKLKQHLKTEKDHIEEHYMAVCIKTNKDAVPSYRFHHVEIKKNILTPNTMLTFMPHLRDLKSSEEPTYSRWLKELKNIDLKSGFKQMNCEEKHTRTTQSERATTISLYLDSWLDALNMPHCNKLTLIRYMASLTPQQKTDIIEWHSDGNDMTAEARNAAEMFTAAFQLVFEQDRPVSKQVDLRKVLLLDESVNGIMENTSAVKEIFNPKHDNEDVVAESNLATYGIFGCLICFSHSCDHGEYDNKNSKRTFSLLSHFELSDVLKKKRAGTAVTNGITETKCRRRCHRLGASSNWDAQSRQWSDDERIFLRSLFIAVNHSTAKMDPICLAAEFLNRNCCEVYAEFQSLGISIPEPKPAESVRPRNIQWYDHRKKMLQGDWQERTVSHEHQRREILEPCFHDGPCAPKVCGCVDAGVLCEKFCGCTVQSCSYKFTGCACHAQGRTCYTKQKDKPCICVQLNRECDPQLCGSCGALERADPANADNHWLHSTGCQNCELQRGVHKSLLLGQSQLDGVGYGLFTAEDIALDEFIIEYVGELITHDEGVRREARRSDVFDKESNNSYLFTLLENEGIWIDAAIYGNLSRYINHASEHDTCGCNITPRILYVNGEYRIKFIALRDIKAGEELFFDYGENFPNLTKKPEATNGKRRPRLVKADDQAARVVEPRKKRGQSMRDLKQLHKRQRIT